MAASNLELVRHILIETNYYPLPIPEPQMMLCQQYFRRNTKLPVKQLCQL